MENISRLFSAKFDTIASALEKIKSDRARQLQIELEAIRTRFSLSTGHIFIKAVEGGNNKKLAREDFIKIITSENFSSDLNLIVAEIISISGIGSKQKSKLDFITQKEIKLLIEQYASHNRSECDFNIVKIDEPVGEYRYNWCMECSIDMEINANASELECPNCHKCRELVGTVFDDTQFYNQEGQKAKSGSFNPNRHFRFWMDHILAREPEEELGDKDDQDNTCGELLLEKLRVSIKKNNKILRCLTVDDIRSLLKEINRTDLNKNVSLILKKLTGIGPPQISESLYQIIEKLFSKAIEIGESVRPSSRPNRNYYPYYIYKIFDHVLSEDDFDTRRILYYIYMQGDETIDKNDREWEEICSRLPEINWIPTDKTKASRYFSHHDT